MKNILRHTLATLSLALLLTACSKNDDDTATMPMNPRPNVVFYALTSNNQIAKYNAATAEMADATISVNNLPQGENLLSIDFRPATGQLYALGSSSRLYTINLTNGNATPLGTAPFMPMLSGTVASIDFNPTVDRIRLVTNSGQNLRLHPELGTVVATDGAINGAANVSITSIAYTNNMAGAATTELFNIDLTNKKLFKQNPPNDGTLQEVGTININFSGRSGFDINDDNSVMLATFNVNGTNQLYSINTSNVAVTYLANINNNIVDIAIPTAAVAYAISEMGMFQIFNPTKANSVINKNITGLATGETLMGIDFRPTNGQLYGITTNGMGMAKLYTFNLSTGAATAVGMGFALNTSSTAIGFDFNPTVDRIRLVTNSGQNLRLNPNDGTIAATDANINPGTPMIHGAAYTNNFAGATSTVMYVTDMSKLYRQDPPNNGTLVEIGNLGIMADSQNGFDIGGMSNMAFALFSVGNSHRVYSINLNSGAATAGIEYPNKVRAMAVGLGF
jgi:hypothetical protein